jgi:hypothetical protein
VDAVADKGIPDTSADKDLVEVDAVKALPDTARG